MKRVASLSTIRKVLLAFFILGFLQQGFAQKYGKTAEDSVECVRNLSLMGDFFKEKQYDKALPYLRKTFEICPASSEYIYVRGNTIYKDHYNKVKDKAQKAAVLDTILMYHDKRIENFPESKGKALGRKGVDMAILTPDKKQDIYNVLTEALKIEGGELEAASIDVLFQISNLLYKDGVLKKEDIIDLYDKLSSIAEKNSKTNKSYEKVVSNLETVFGESGVADCEALVNIYTPKFNQTPNDAELLDKITKLMDKTKCSSEKLYMNAAVNLDKIQPSANSKSKIAKMYFAQDKLNESLKYYEEAVELETENSKKAEYYLDMAKINQKRNNFPAARTLALKAASANSGWGEPYILIGDLYASSAKQCGDNEFKVAAVYLLAVDKYEKARKLDDASASVAASKIATFSKYFPKKSEAFFHGYNNGDSYTAECWINESTTVRTIND